MGSLIIPHVIFKTVLVIFRLGLSILTSVLETRVLIPMSSIWADSCSGDLFGEAEPPSSNRSGSEPKVLLPGNSEIKHVRPGQRRMPEMLLYACEIRRN